MRIVEEKVVAAGVGRLRSGEGGATTAKEYATRVASYVPAEIVAVYMTANGFATQAMNPGLWYALIFFICLILTPWYITRFAKTRREAWTNGVMATAAFVIWSYAFGGGIVAHLDWYDPAGGSVMLALFSLFSGMVQPISRQQPPQPTIMM